VVVILNPNNPNLLVRRFAHDFNDESPLVVYSHRTLVISVALQLLEVQGFLRVEVSFIQGSPDRLHAFPESIRGRFSMSAVGSGVNFDLPQCLVSVIDIQASAPSNFILRVDSHIVKCEIQEFMNI
jgi:hypothetical protein